MGRPPAEIDENTLLSLCEKMASPAEMALELGVSIPTVTSRIKKLQETQGVLLQYRAVRNLHLTNLQAQCLEAITPDKIQDAEMIDLVRAFKILHDAEVETKDSGKMSGLVAALIQIEKEEIGARTKITETKQILAMAEGQEACDEMLENFMSSSDSPRQGRADN